MPPTKFSRYEIKAELGRGGMATVYRAYDPSFDREVALKVLPREFLHDPQFKGRFQREIKTVARLEHPAIVPVYDVGEEDGQPFFVMRYMTGGSLSDWIKRGKFSLEDTARIIERLAGALAYAHAKGVVHRDLKPDNVLFDNNGDPFISDFGIAKLEEAASTLTGSGVVGTPAYMSPEQAQSNETDNRSDIYGLGVIIFQMLIGRQPYEADTPMGVIVKHITEPVPEILQYDSALSPEVDAVIKTAMAKDKGDRYPTAIKLAQALNLAAFGKEGNITEPAVTMPVKGTKSRSGSRLGFIIGGVVLIVALLGGFLFRDQLFGAETATLTPIPTIAATETEVVEEATPTQPVPTATADEPTPTQELPTAIPIPGETDLIAIVTGNEIWTMNTDGTNITPVTSDGAPKSNLQWLPDGKSLLYLSGKCARIVNIETNQIQTVFCFRSATNVEGPRLSPDGESIALSLDRELIIVPFDLPVLSRAQDKYDLLDMENSCSYSEVSTKDILWSNDGNRLAVVYVDVTGERFLDKIRVLDISNCTRAGSFAVDQFPTDVSSVHGYQNAPTIPGFDWDGGQRFLFNDVERNEGFGNLYFYDMTTRKLERFNPIDGTCCYRDARWSPDGKYVLFLYQDLRQGVQSRNQLYFASFEDLQAGQYGSPIQLPVQMFASPREQPHPSLRPVQ